MHSHKINTLITSQGSPGFVWFHGNHAHGPVLQGDGYVVAHVKLPKTHAYPGGFPVDSYHVTVTPSTPGCAVSVTNKDTEGFDVVLSSLDGKGMSEGTFSVMVIG